MQRYPYTYIVFLQHIVLSSCQITLWACIHCPHLKPILIGCCYRPPGTDTHSIFEWLMWADTVADVNGEMFLTRGHEYQMACKSISNKKENGITGMYHRWFLNQPESLLTVLAVHLLHTLTAFTQMLECSTKPYKNIREINLMMFSERCQYCNRVNV